MLYYMAFMLYVKRNLGWKGDAAQQSTGQESVCKDQSATVSFAGPSPDAPCHAVRILLMAPTLCEHTPLPPLPLLLFTVFTAVCGG